MSIKAENDITLVRVDDGSAGEPGTSVSEIVKQFYLSTSKSSPTGGSWSETMPMWSNGKYLWTRDKIVYTNPSSTEYTTPQCDSSWEAVNLVEVGARNYALGTGEPISAVGRNVDNQGIVLYPLSLTVEELNAIPTGCLIMSFDMTISSRITGTSGTPSISVGQQNTPWNRIAVTETEPGTYHKEIVIPNRAWTTVGTSARVNFIDTDCEITFFNFKMEVGNKYTDWTPAPEDMASLEGLEEVTANLNTTEEQIVDLQENATQIAENVNGLNTSVDNLNAEAEELREMAEGELVARGYAKITSEPSLELGRGTADWKVKITNNSVDLQKAGSSGAKLSPNPDRANETLFRADSVRLANMFFRSADNQGHLGLVAQSNGHVSLKEI